MTGPEHYARAQRLLADIDCDGPRLWSDERDRATRGYGAEVVAAVAQVHATLAAAAATADLFALTGQEGRTSAQAWREVVTS